VPKLAAVAFSVLVLWLVVVATGCEEEGGSEPTTTYVPPPPPPPPPATTTETPTTPGETTTEVPPTSGESSPRAEYPLTQQQAYSLVEAGTTVAGYRPNSFEVLIFKSSETEYVEEPVQEKVCDYEYDPLEGESVYECDWETVYKEQPVEKTVYEVRIPQSASVSFPNAAGAFARAAQLGAQEFWRTL
jgi:hypothetical protein